MRSACLLGAFPVSEHCHYQHHFKCAVNPIVYLLRHAANSTDTLGLRDGIYLKILPALDKSSGKISLHSETWKLKFREKKH